MTPIIMATPRGFRFVTTVLSHGWCELLPFSYNERDHILERVQQLSDGHVVKLLIGPGEEKPSLSVTVEGLNGALTNEKQAEVGRLVSRCLKLEQDLNDFYRLLRGRPRYQWVEPIGAGRLLGAPTIWEDLVKTLLTTNTTWNVTVQMCRRLIALGDRYASGSHCFPTPQQIACLSLNDLTNQVRAGYRTVFLHDLATAIAEGTLDVEGWGNPELTSEELYRRIRALKGFGEYAAGSMLKLLGRFDRLGIDTSCREVFRVQLNDGNKASDDEIRGYYELFGSWRGLTMWMDVMRVSFLSRGLLREEKTDT